MTDADGNSCYHTVEQQEHQEAGEEANPHIGCHLRHARDVVTKEEHPKELVIQAEDEHQVEETKEPVAVLEEKLVKDIEVDEIDDEWRLQQVPYHPE